MKGRRPIHLYWWSPWRQPRSALWELRRNRRAWVGMLMHGGRPLQNFGDELSRRVVSEVTGRTVRWSAPDSAGATAIGSVLEHLADADASGLIWGTGLRQPEAAPVQWARRNSDRFLAVRGALTRDALDLPYTTPLGDPGLLIRTFVPRAKRTRGVVVVPHFLAFNSRPARRQLSAARALGFRVIAPSVGYTRICEEVSRASLVLSSSLHGMVIADALGCPVQLTRFGVTTEPSFKFSDYQSVFGLTADFTSFDPELLARDLRAIHESAEQRRDVVARTLDDVVEQLRESAAPLAAL